MHRKSQSAVEFISTYSFVFLIIAIVLFLLFLFSSIPTKILPFQCTVFSGFSCIDVIYRLMGSNSQIVVSLTDTQPGVINVGAFYAKINSVAAIGTCTPSALLPGNVVTCTATLPLTASSGGIYSGVFNITANYCTNGVGNISNTTCSAGSSFVYAGSLTAQAQPPTTSTTTVQYIYCVGTIRVSTYNQVYYAPVSSTGVGTWSSTGNYPVAIYRAGCSIYGGYIYCVGTTASPSNQVYYALVSSTGVGTWSSTGNYPVAMEEAGCSIYNSYIYCVGTADTGTDNQVYYAPVSSTGIGTWSSTTGYPVMMYLAGCSINRGYIYCVGTQATAGENQVYYAPVSSTGIGTWSSTANYPVQMDSGGCSIYGNYIYCVGTEGGAQNYAYYAPVSSTGIGTWSSTTNYPIVKYDSGCSISGGYIYCVSGSSPYNQVYYAPVSSTGIGTWSSTANYPVPLSMAYCEMLGSGGGYLGGGGPD